MRSIKKRGVSIYLPVSALRRKRTWRDVGFRLFRDILSIIVRGKTNEDTAMKRPTYQWLGQMLATLGVIISLLLVAYELKQSRDIAIADLTMRVMQSEKQERILGVLDVHAYNKAVMKVDRGEFDQITDWEQRNLARIELARMHNFDMAHMLWEMGLIEDEDWLFKRQDIQNLFNNPMWVEQFKFPWVRSDYPGRKSFVDEVNQMYREWQTANLKE